MKKSKLLIPMMVFVMAIGMAFTSKTSLNTGLWVERNGVPYELKNNPCTSTEEIHCRVVFADDPNPVEYPVYTDKNFTFPKLNGRFNPYIIME